MKKLFFLSVLLLFTLNLYCQKTKSILIWKKPITDQVLRAHYILNDKDSLETINIHFMAKDDRYSQLIDYITIYSGTPIEFYFFLTELEKFYKENEPETSMEIHGQYVSVQKFMGTKQLWIYEKDGNGYHIFLIAWIQKFKEKFVAWANQNKIPYIE